MKTTVTLVCLSVVGGVVWFGREGRQWSSLVRKGSIRSKRPIGRRLISPDKGARHGGKAPQTYVNLRSINVIKSLMCTKVYFLNV